MSRSKEHRFQVAGKERENGWQNCKTVGVHAVFWGKADWQKERKKERKVR
jgi:hypothetical protein